MSIADNIPRIQETIALAAEKSGRTADDITLIAVSKQKPVAALEAAYAAGLRNFGENRSAELADKANTLAALDINWHFIGHLQTRQSKPIAAHALWFHAADRVKIATRLNNQLGELNRPALPIFLEVNVSGEATKGGFQCGNWERDGAQRDAILTAAATVAALNRIEIRGLMTMAPYGAPETDIRTIFERTRKLAEWLATQLPQADWSQLSMGMTDDYAIAIEEGATHVRVGRAIFGERKY